MVKRDKYIGEKKGWDLQPDSWGIHEEGKQSIMHERGWELQPDTWEIQDDYKPVVGGGILGRVGRGARSVGAGLVKERNADGFTIFILGLIWWLLSLGLEALSWNSSGFNILSFWSSAVIVLKVPISIGFALFTCITVFKKKGFTLIILGLIYYNLLSYTNAYTSALNFGILMLGIFLLWGYATSRENWREWVAEQLKYGGILFLAFALDVELAYFFIGGGKLGINFGISLTSALLSIIRTIPIWATVGAFTADAEAHKGIWSTIIKISQFGIIIWILVIVVPFIPSTGFDSESGKVPTLTDVNIKIQQTKQTVQKESGWQVIYDQFSCLWAGITDPEGIKKCQEDKRIERKCGHPKEDSDEYKACVAELTIKIESQSDDIKTFEISLERGAQYPAIIEEDAWLPFLLKVDNYNDERISIKCIFYTGDTPQVTEVAYEPGSFLFDFTCKVPKGATKLDVNITISGLKTYTYLSRIFVAKTTEEIKRLASEMSPDLWSQVTGPKNALARLDFSAGSSTVINYNEKPLLIGSVKDSGRGKIEKINAAEVQATADLGTTGDCNLKHLPEDSYITFQKQDEKVQFGPCMLQAGEILRSLIESKGMHLVNFIGYLNYDYTISRTETLR